MRGGQGGAGRSGVGNSHGGDLRQYWAKKAALEGAYSIRLEKSVALVQCAVRNVKN